MKQRSVAKAVNASGVGLHSGEVVDVKLLPADADTGIVFVRTDLSPAVTVPLDPFSVHDTLMSTNLEKNGVRIGTAEHLMSALAAYGIDNLRIEVSAPEVPIMDGSAAAFVRLIEEAGVLEQPKQKKFIRVRESVRVELEDKWAELTPYEGFELEFEVEFDHPAMRHASVRKHSFSTQNFLHEIACCRTFGFIKDLDFLKTNNLARGGSLDNAVVFDDTGVLNPEGMRFDDEFLRHKILDAVGDLYLGGRSILGRYTAFKSGHKLNNMLLTKLLSSPEAFELIEVSRSPINFEVPELA